MITGSEIVKRINTDPAACHGIPMCEQERLAVAIDAALAEARAELRAELTARPVERRNATEARYLDDMRDGHELVILLDDQGDVYVSVLPEGHRIGPTVRLCASGGAAERAPGLLQAMREAHRAIRKERCDECDWTFGCFSGEQPCRKRPL